MQWEVLVVFRNMLVLVGFATHVRTLGLIANNWDSDEVCPGNIFHNVDSRWLVFFGAPVVGVIGRAVVDAKTRANRRIPVV